MKESSPRYRDRANSDDESIALHDDDDVDEEEEDGETAEPEPPLSSSSSSLFNFLFPPLPTSSPLYTSMNLPVGCLAEHDGCDEAEVLARAKRCQEILKLSQHAQEAEAARIKAANIKPLSWAEPTFALPSETSSSTADTEPPTDEPLDDKAGKRKRPQEEEAPSTKHSSIYDLDRQHYPKRRPTPEELQAFIDFSSKWTSSCKRVSVESERDGSDREEEEEETQEASGARPVSRSLSTGK